MYKLGVSNAKIVSSQQMNHRWRSHEPQNLETTPDQLRTIVFKSMIPDRYENRILVMAHPYGWQCHKRETKGTSNSCHFYFAYLCAQDLKELSSAKPTCVNIFKTTYLVVTPTIKMMLMQSIAWLKKVQESTCFEYPCKEQ